MDMPPKIAANDTKPMTRRRMLRLSAYGLGVAASVTGLYTWGIEPHWVEVVERSLPVKNLPDALVNARCVQLSDLHIGPQVDDGYLRSCFDTVNALAPHIVVYTGDFMTHSSDFRERAQRIFPHLPRGTRGTFGVLGNHDYGPNWQGLNIADDIARFAVHSGVRILRNEIAEVDGLQIVGLDDLWAGRFDVALGLKALNAERPAIALSHNPDSVDLTGWERFTGWILSGHTHGGQCKAPFLPPPLLPVLNRRYVAGEYDLPGNRRLYISRGLGHLMHVRFNVRPEITAFRLERMTFAAQNLSPRVLLDGRFPHNSFMSCRGLS